MQPRWVFHPLLISVFPTLSLYSANLDAAPASNLVRPILYSLALTAVLWGGLLSLMRDKLKSAELTSLLLVAFWVWKFFEMLVNDVMTPDVHIRHRYLFPCWCVFTLLAFWMVYRSQRSRVPATRVLNVATSILVAMPLANVVLSCVSAGSRNVEIESQDLVSSEPVEEKYLPDIYYIILDGYGRADVLANQGFAFEHGLGETLPDLGFYVGSRSNANYPQTAYSVASSLNFDYIHDLTADVPESRQNRLLVGQLIRENAVVRLLKEYGYRHVACSTGFHLTEDVRADLRIGPPVELSEFEIMLLNGTPLRSFHRMGSLLTSPYALHRRRIETCIQTLPLIAEDPAPTFTFAHMLVPHHPFVFGPNGEDVGPRDRDFDFGHAWWRDATSTEPGKLNGDYARNYRDQVTYVSKIVFESVRRILENSPAPPIIVVQGDHGPNGFLDPQPPHIRFPILNAYHLPRDGAEDLYASISPVNSFRIILRHYFGIELELLPDRRYRVRPPGFNSVEVRE